MLQGAWKLGPCNGSLNFFTASAWIQSGRFAKISSYNRNTTIHAGDQRSGMSLPRHGEHQSKWELHLSHTRALETACGT